MKALSIRQPWAFFILSGLKKIECRGWPAPESMVGQKFLIHAGKKMILQEYEALQELFLKGFVDATYFPPPDHLDTGALLGIATLIEVKHYPYPGDFYADKDLHLCHSRLFEPTEYGFVIEVEEDYSNPIPYPGRLKFFDVPDEVLKGAS